MDRVNHRPATLARGWVITDDTGQNIIYLCKVHNSSYDDEIIHAKIADNLSRNLFRPSARYFPEIDGLRAIAVISVFLYHLNSQIVPGGFVGVDVFFVISGFLITNQILKELDEGHFSYARFYQRRIARIAPAAIFVTIATLIAGFLLYDRQELASLGANSSAAALSAMNIKQLFEGGYFKTSPDAQPLIHYWSLAVEEQFYVVFPIMAHLLTRMGQNQRKYILIGTCLASYLASIILTPHTPVAAYYLLHTRAWELLAGSVLAAFKLEKGTSEWRWVGLRIYGGLVLIILGMIVSRGNAFPGWIAALPVGGATLILSALDTSTKMLPHRLLASRAFTFTGRISYSLYLWHWPIFSFVAYQCYRQPPYEVYTLKIALAFFAAILSFYFVEQPARRSLNLADHRLLAFGGFAVVSAALAWSGIATREANYLSALPNSMTKGGIVINAGKKQSVALIGDSQGAMYGYEIGQIAKANGFTLHVFAEAAGNELPHEPQTEWPKIEQFLKRNHFDGIIVAQAWAEKLGPDGHAHLEQALAALSPYADHILLVSQLPATPDAATRQDIFTGRQRLPVREPATAHAKRLRADRLLADFTSSHISVINIAEIMIAPDDTLRLIAPNGRITYHDPGHLTSTGAGMLHERLVKSIQVALNAGR